MKRFHVLCILLPLICFSMSGQDFKWTKSKIDGSRTGVTAPTDVNIKEALGTVDAKGNYTAPNGRKFKAGSATAAAASLMIDAQPAMAPVKEAIGYATVEMKRRHPQCELSNWFIDFLMEATAEKTGKHIDVGIYNFGGIRADMPQGTIVVDDIISMFPFKNTLCRVALKGSDLLKIYKWLAETGMQVVGGVKIVVRDHKLESVMIGDEPLDPDKVYGVATINFLLNGGDGLFIARNAQELDITDVYVKDAVIPYVKRLMAESRAVEYHLDDRITIIESPVE